MPNKRIVEGPQDAKIVFVGEACGHSELSEGLPFAGMSGFEHKKMLGEAGISYAQTYHTNVIHDYAPFNNFFKKQEAAKRGISLLNSRYPHPKVLAGRAQLHEELRELKPNVIVPLGDMALWAVTGELGITKWRGSMLESEFGKVIPTFNPAAIQRNWPWRWLSLADLRRVKKEAEWPEVRKPAWNFLIRPTFDEAMDAISSIRGKLVAGDIEGWGEVACVGFATDKLNAFCIPFHTLKGDKSYWSREDELKIVLHLKEVLQDPTTRCIFQNGLYDAQCFAKDWGYIFNMSEDTIIMFHVCYPALAKSLALQSSLICEYHRFWKDDGKTWEIKGDEEQGWIYNCEDCVRTYEIFEHLDKTIDTYKLRDQYLEQMSLLAPLLNMMLHGIRIDMKARREQSGQLLVANASRMTWLEKVVGYPVNPNSPKQVAELFYDDLGQKEIKNRKTKGLTTDDEALDLIKTRQPVLTPLVDCFKELRSIGVFKSNFIDAQIDRDQHIRGTFNPTGANTYRFSHSKNFLGGGCNLGTIPKGVEKDV